MNHVQLFCPKCGEPVDDLYEGYCFDCLEEMQAELHKSNFEHDAWQKLSEEERNVRIKNAVKFH